MKKILSLIAIVCLSLTAGHSQTVVKSMVSVTYPTLLLDTVTNTATNSVLITTTQAYSNITIQPTVTKISGTLNAGTTPQLYGSIDGTKYYAIAGDSLHITNVATIQTAWVLTQQNYKYYKITWTGYGTMSATLAAKVFLVQ